MSLHRSLAGVAGGAQHRSVLKRLERIKLLKKQGKFAEDQSAYSLPKVKTVKIKIKKGGKSAAAGEKAPAKAAPAASAPAAASAAKPEAKKQK